MKADILRLAAASTGDYALWTGDRSQSYTASGLGIGLAEAFLSADRPHQRGTGDSSARGLVDPTNPQLLLQEAQYRYRAGEQEESRRMLEPWLRQNRGPALAVLLYHGLSATTNDPMLAARIHMPVTVFEEHMARCSRPDTRRLALRRYRLGWPGQANYP